MSDRQLIKKVLFLAEDPCSTCFSAYLHEKKQIKKTVDRLAGSRDSPIGKKKSLFLSELPNDVVISTLVEPLSDENRFAMLKEHSPPAV